MASDALGIPTRAIIYCRISRDREGAGLAVERQREDCEALAAQLGLEVVACYTDNDLSAYSGKPRPGYQQLLEDLRAGRADTVLAWHTDRLHRSPAELEEYIDVCEPGDRSRSVQTRTVKAGTLDLSTATGRMIARQLGVQARYEVERMIERQKRKRDEMAKNGQYLGGRRPFGYESDGVTPRSLVCFRCGLDDPDDFTITVSCRDCGASGAIEGWSCTKCGAPNGRHVWADCRSCGSAAQVLADSEFAQIRQASEAVLAGASLRSIAAAWNGMDPPVLTSTGIGWRQTEVRSMLLRERNAGIFRHRGEEAGPANWPAPLDEPTWRSLIALIEDPSRRTSPGGERKYLGSGMYECGQCSAKSRIVTSNRAERGQHEAAYSCRKVKNHFVRKIEPVDQYVQLLVLERLSRPDVADVLAAREDPVDVSGAQRQMREARQTLDALAAALGAGEMDLQEWKVARQSARGRLEAAEAVLARAVKANPIAGLVGAEDVEAEWKRLDLSRMRAVVSYLMTVRLHPGRKGRLPGGTYFDADSVEIVWK
ncbi:recombinase family protein [Streptomyces sp. NPDC048241]|uniref:recombinase family protein n=1 Tax=Streptomyces sp. NPDC048241 TaxID=3365521 RepID=UPI0037117691